MAITYMGNKILRPNISIIIVNYNSYTSLVGCINSILSSKQSMRIETVIVDNDEENTTGRKIKKLFPEVKHVRSKKNLGFGAGNNWGANFALGKYLFFLNPDTVVLPGAIEKLYNFTKEHRGIGIVSPLLLDEDLKTSEIVGSQHNSVFNMIFSLSFIHKLFPGNPIAKNFFLKNWDKKAPLEVGVAPGAALMISKEVFKRVGGFDENFFLFFEEADLARKVNVAGLKNYIIPQAKAIHIGAVSTRTRDDISEIFKKSQYYYFKKWHGTLTAIFINLVTSINKYHIGLFFVFLLGFFLRFYKISDIFPFEGETGDNLLTIKNYFYAREIPLIGPPTSHPWLYFGPFFYWIYGPILWLFKFNPVSHAYFGAFCSLIIIPLNYFFVKKLFGPKIAIISSFLISFSPLFLSFSVWGRFFSIITLLIYPLMYFFYKILEGEKKYLLHFAFTYSIMFGFHYSQLMLLPFFIMMFLYKKIHLSLRQFLISLVVFFIPFIPFVFYDLSKGTDMIKNLILWIPYRVLGFVGLYPKNTLSEKVLTENTSSIMDFINQSFLFTKDFSLLFLSAIIFALIFILIKKRKSFPHVFIALWFFWGVLAVFVHGSPPIHYFLPILPLPIILFSIFLSKVTTKKVGKFIVIFFLLFLFLSNVKHLFSSQWFYKPITKLINFSVPYNLQLRIADSIIKDASGRRFVLKRVGQNDQFEKDYAQNYIYILWWKGNEPRNNSNLSYTIYEDIKKFPKKLGSKEKVLQISNIKTLVNEKK